jgi:hypothetical protein
MFRRMTANETNPQRPLPKVRLYRLDKMLQIRAPESLAAALDAAALKKLTSRSDYIRVALLDRLKADGIDLAAA